MKSELIVVADSSEARLFTRDSDRDPLVPLATLLHPQSRQKPSELGGGRPGHGSSDSHPGGVNFEPRIDPRRKQHMAFAHELSQRIDALLAEGRHDRLTLFAASPFIGELKGQLRPASRKALRAAVDLDLMSLGSRELEQRMVVALAEAQPHPHP